MSAAAPAGAPALRAEYAALPEYAYSFGDPRADLFEYACSLAGLESYTTRFEDSTIFHFFCGETVREIRGPAAPEAEAAFYETVAAGATSVVIPVMLHSRFRCVKRNTARHLNLLIYNPQTHEVVRIDPRKFHIRGFTIKLAFKKMRAQLAHKILREVDEDARMQDDLEIPPGFGEKMGSTALPELYPIYAIAYLNMCARHPTKSSAAVMAYMARMSKATLLAFWRDYVAFCVGRSRRAAAAAAAAADCPEPEKIRNTETGRCLQTTGATAKAAQIWRRSSGTAAAECSAGRSWNAITQRCVGNAAATKINLFLEEAIREGATSKKRYPRLGGNDRNIQAILYLTGRYSNVAIIAAPAAGAAAAADIRDYSMIWSQIPQEASGAAPDAPFALWIPPRFRESWDAALAAPAIRFLVVFLRLEKYDKSRHANALIYDKASGELERFDSMGTELADSYKPDELDAVLRTHFPQIPYYPPAAYCPRKASVFQAKEVDELAIGGDLYGNCAVWRLWYLKTRFENPHLSRDKLVRYAMTALDNYGSVQQFIKGFQLYAARLLAAAAPQAP